MTAHVVSPGGSSLSLELELELDRVSSCMFEAVVCADFGWVGHCDVAFFFVGPGFGSVTLLGLFVEAFLDL